jgi:hypothetical protein
VRRLIQGGAATDPGLGGGGGVHGVSHHLPQPRVRADGLPRDAVWSTKYGDALPRRRGRTVRQPRHATGAGTGADTGHDASSTAASELSGIVVVGPSTPEDVVDGTPPTSRHPARFEFDSLTRAVQGAFHHHTDPRADPQADGTAIHAKLTPAPPIVARKRPQRSRSFAGQTERERTARERKATEVGLKKLALAVAKETMRHERKVATFAAMCFFLFSMILCYSVYRLIACDRLRWQCKRKTLQNHFEDVTEMMVISGVLFATGPTMTADFVFVPLLCLFAGCFTFGGMGENQFLMNSLVSSDAWKPPAVFVYVGAFFIVTGILIHSLRTSRSRWELGVTVLAIIGIGLVYASAPLAAAMLGQTLPTFQPHHFELAWSLALCLRNESDKPSVICRHVLFGVFVQGVAAYSAGSMVT